MRAVVLKRFGGAENLADAEVPEPAPGPGEVKIRARLDEGALEPPAVTEVGPLAAENVGRAHALLEGGHVQGKLVLAVGGEA